AVADAGDGVALPGLREGAGRGFLSGRARPNRLPAWGASYGADRGRPCGWIDAYLKGGSMPQARSVTRSEREAIARRMRRDIIKATTAAASGHPSSSLSMVEILTTLYFG